MAEAFLLIDKAREATSDVYVPLNIRYSMESPVREVLGCNRDTALHEKGSF